MHITLTNDPLATNIATFCMTGACRLLIFECESAALCCLLWYGRMVESVADLDLWRRWHSQPTWEPHLRMCVQTNYIIACVVCTYTHNEIHQLHTKYKLPITSGNVNSLFWSTMAFTV